MLIGSRQRLSTLPNTLELSINNVPINRVSSVKSLGVLIDENLTWQTHIDKLSKKIASGIGAIKRVRTFVPPATLLYIYSALIQPHFDYCNLVWGNCGKTLSDRLQKLQNRAARVLTFSSYDTDAKSLIRQLGWKDLCTQRQIQKALMVYKSRVQNSSRLSAVAGTLTTLAGYFSPKKHKISCLDRPTEFKVAVS